MAQRGSHAGHPGAAHTRHQEGHGQAAGAHPDSSRLGVLRPHIVRLADKAPGTQHLPEAEEQLELLSQALKRDLVAYEDQILQITLECMWELPHKLPYYGTLLGLLNVGDYNFVQRAVEAVHAGLQAALSAGDPLNIRLGLRILATLVSNWVLSAASVVRVFQALVTEAVAALDTAPPWQARGDWYVYAVLGALPWGGKELALGAPSAVTELLDLVQTYVDNRERLALPALHAFSTQADGTPTTQQPDYVEALHAAVAALAQGGTWSVKSVPRPQAQFLARLQAAEQHSVPTVAVPPLPALPPDLSPLATARARFDALQAYPPDTPRLRIFPSEKTDQGLSAVERWVVEVCLADVLRAFNGARKECTLFLVNLPVPFRHEFLTAEAIFTHMLALPRPPFRLVYYSVVLTDLCKALPAAFPAVVGQAVSALFARLPAMDPEPRARLASWLAHHLANCGFAWPLEHWEAVAALPPWHAQRRFCAAVLERALRLAYWDKLRETLPDALAPLMPPPPGASFVYAASAEGSEAAEPAPEHSFAQQLTDMIRSKKTSKEVSAWLDAAVLPAVGAAAALRCVGATVLHIGSKTLTHLVTMLERYQPVLARLAPDRPAQAALVAIAAQFWAASQQMTSLCIDRLMGCRLVSNLAIVDWAFSPACLPSLHSSDQVWEVLAGCLAKTHARTVDLAASVALEAAAAQAARDEAQRLASAVGLEAEAAAGRAQEAAVSAGESLEVRQALHARAAQEQEALLRTVLDQLVTAIEARQQQAHAAAESGAAREEAASNGEGPPADGDAEGGPTAMQVDDGGAVGAGGAPGEAEEAAAWEAAVMGQLRAITRQYAQQLWPLVAAQKLEILTRSGLPAHVKQAVYEGLCASEQGETEARV